MVMPGGTDPSVQSLVGDLTGFLRRNLPQPAPRRPMPMPAQRPPMQPGTAGMDPEALGRALLGPDADPETIRRMLASIAAANGPRTDPAMARLDAMALSRTDRAAPQGPAPDWTQGVAQRAQPLGLPPQQLAGAGLMGLSMGLPVASPLAGAIAGGIGGTGASVMGGARTPTEAVLGGGVPGALAGPLGMQAARGVARSALAGDAGDAIASLRSRIQGGTSAYLDDGARAAMPMAPAPAQQPMPRPVVDAQAQEGLASSAGMAQHSDPYFPAPGPMPRNDRNVGGQFIRPWRAEEIQGALSQPAGLPQQSLLQRFEGEMARTQPGSPVADAGLRGMDPGDWFAKTQPDVGMAGRLEGAIPQQDRIMEMLRRQAPNPLMQPAGMPDPNAMRAFFQALSGLRGP